MIYLNRCECGGVKIILTKDKGLDDWFCTCRKCGYHTDGYERKSDAAEAWNKREIREE